jgi:NAD(P)-dependent dehydrogenase (short-subunit alcohol dehydrogenase family)
MSVDVSDADAVRRMAQATQAAGTLGALVHTAGLSPALADWRPILKVNLVGTALLLDAFLPLATDGTAVVCIGSVAGHGPQPDAVLKLIDAPLAPQLIDELEPLLRSNPMAEVPFGLQGLAYGVSKFAVLRLCEQRAAAWAQRGARIVSVSPGMIATPMGKKEMETNDLAARMMDAVPKQRVGSPIEIANAVDFLCSDYASYITGCDLRVDYGAVAGLRFPGVN